MTGFEGEIRSHDRVCFTCYKSHLVILKQNKPVSKDSDLQQLIDTYYQQIPSVDQVITTQDVITIAMARTLVTVGKELLGNRAMLLTSIHSLFNKYAKDLVKAKNMPEPQELTTISSRWILSKLTHHYNTTSYIVAKYVSMEH